MTCERGFSAPEALRVLYLTKDEFVRMSTGPDQFECDGVLHAGFSLWATSQLFRRNSNVPFSIVRESDACQYVFQLEVRYPRLVLMESQLGVHQPESS
jgi:hypothetical protein